MLKLPFRCTQPCSEETTQLHTAVQKGNLREVRLFLNSPSTNWWCNQKKRLMMKMDKNGMCPVHIAAMEGRHYILKEFVQAMPNCINIRSRDYKTTLHFAVEHGQLEAVKVLLYDKNSKIGRKLVSHDYDEEGNTALHLAAIHEVDPQIVLELLKWPGVNVNAVNKEGLTALDIAAHSSTVSAQRDRRTRSAKIRRSLEGVGGRGRYSRQSERNDRKIVDVDTVVASLIATMTFAAIFQIPGGIEDDKNSAMYGGAKSAILPSFRSFLTLNTSALFTSLTVMIMWLLRQRLPEELLSDNLSRVSGLSAICLGVSIVCTGLAYISAYVVIVPPDNKKSLRPKEYNILKYLSISVVGAAGFAPIIAWTGFFMIVVYKFSNCVFTRKPYPRLFPISVLCTWVAASTLVGVGTILFFRVFYHLII